jgi:hypothetical protein
MLEQRHLHDIVGKSKSLHRADRMVASPRPSVGAPAMTVRLTPVRQRGFWSRILRLWSAVNPGARRFKRPNKASRVTSKTWGDWDNTERVRRATRGGPTDHGWLDRLYSEFW